jgi:hypothetical protein
MSFFGWDIQVGEFWLMLTILGGGSLWSAYQLAKAAKLGKVGFKARDYSRAEHPFEFKLYVSLWAVILVCAVLGLVGWYTS